MAPRSKVFAGGRPRVAAAALAVVLFAAALAVLMMHPGPAGRTHGTAADARHPGIARLLAASAGTAGDRVTGQVPQVTKAVTGSLLQGVATLGGPATRGRVRALERLGLQVQPLARLPLAFVAGTPTQLLDAVLQGAAADVYPNERLQYLSTESNAPMRVDVIRQDLGLTGKGVGVAIVDSGVDATHPDLADHVTHNFKVINGDYLGDPLSKLIPPVVVPVDDLPYRNTDLTTGHGTHVAGIVAADGHTSPDQTGVAPDATIVGYSCGDVAFLFTQIAAFDSILQHHDEWNIRVVNNSWGSTFGIFDPANPINVATRAIHDAGITVVFAAGNAGEQMTLSPFAAAPWVISVGAASLEKERSPFSSAGLQFDNSAAADVPEDNHVHFEGDSLGLYHPTVSAPGVDIVSSGTPTGIGITAPSLPGGTATLSGTSMAAPHIAGLAALLYEAQPNITPDAVKLILQVTAAPMKGEQSALWQAGYGFADAKAAVDLIKRPDFSWPLLAELQRDAEARMLAERPFKVLTTDLWRYQAPPVSVGTEQHSFQVDVPPDTVALRLSVSYPTLPLLGVNPFDYALTLRDAAGTVVARSVSSPVNGLSESFVSLIPTITGRNVPEPKDLFAFGGKWQLHVRSSVSVADPDLPIPGLIGNEVTVALSTLGAKPGGVAPPETPKGPPPPELGGIQLPPLPAIPGLPLAEHELPAIDVPPLPLGCAPGANLRLDLSALLRGGSLIACAAGAG